MINFFFMIRISILLLFFVIGMASDISADPVNTIKIVGNKRITEQTILTYGNIKNNTDLDSNDLNQIVKELYGTDFFEKVDVSLENEVLTVRVVENPIIQSVKFEGIKAKKIREKLQEIILLKPKTSFVKYRAQSDLNLVRSVFKSLGYYFAEVDLTVNQNDNNTIEIVYNCILGEKALINKISFLGDKKIKSRKLRNIIVSEEEKFWKFLSGKKYLDQNRIELDKRLLKSYYLNNGYYNVDIQHASAKYLDSNTFDLNFIINSGEKFKFNELKMNLPIDYDVKSFKKIDKIFADIKGKNYSLNKVEEIIEEVNKIALNEQYEFINARVNEEIIAGNKINFELIFEDLEKFYVQKINIFGNNVTMEEVIRNKFIIDEGDAFNEILHNKTINRIKGSGYFKSVSSEVKDSDEEGKKVIDITVEERPTGEISAGAGVGTTGSQFSVGIRENNYLGKGIAVNTSLSVSASTITGSASITRPNFLYSEKALTYGVVSQTVDNMTEYGYKTNVVGVDVGTRYEQLDSLYFSPSLSINSESLTTSSAATTSLKKQEGSYDDLNFSYGLDYDKRDQRFLTTDGHRSNFYQQIPVISNSAEIINGYEITNYHEIGDNIITTASFYARAVNSLSGDDVRISKRVKLPSRKLRGFEVGKIGPKDGEDFIGGNYSYSLNFTSTVPMLFENSEAADLKVFLDAGNVWGVDYSDQIKDSNEIRSSIGLAMDYFTPMGPLSFSLTQPITYTSSDKTERFRFTLGTTF